MKVAGSTKRGSKIHGRYMWKGLVRGAIEKRLLQDTENVGCREQCWEYWAFKYFELFCVYFSDVSLRSIYVNLYSFFTSVSLCSKCQRVVQLYKFSCE